MPDEIIYIEVQENLEEINIDVSEQNDEINFTVNTTVENIIFEVSNNSIAAIPAEFEQRVVNLEKTGFGLLYNTDYTNLSPLSFPADTEVVLPLSFDSQASNITAELDSSYPTWYTGNKFNGGRLGNNFLMEVFFDSIQETARTKYELFLDTGVFKVLIGTGELSQEIGVEKETIILFTVYVSATLLANPADIKIKFDDNVSGYNFRHKPTLLSYGRGN